MDSLSTNGKLLTAFWTANNFISKKLDNKLSLHGINFTEFLVMLHLHAQVKKQARRADLAERIGLTASGITRMLAPMEKIGLIQKEKNNRDARVSLVKITKAGERVLSDSMISINEISENIFSNIQSKDKEKLFDGISSIYSATIF